MKKLVLFILVLLCNKTFSQIPVTDVAVAGAIGGVNVNLGVTNTQLSSINSQITSDNQSILKELRDINSVLNDQKKIQEDQKKLQEDIYEIKKNEEDALYQVPEYVKNGNQMNSILDKENEILDLISQLKNIANGGGNITSFIDKILTLLNSEVTTAENICTDNMYRMTVDERINYLKDISSSLALQESLLQQKITQINKQKNTSEKMQENDENYKKLMNKKLTIPNN